VRISKKTSPSTLVYLSYHLTLSNRHKINRAGTGLLALALSPLVRKYTATDIPSLLPLLRKNVLSAPSTASTSTTSVTVTALDWTLPAQRQLDVRADTPDILLVVDCIYHPTLVRPLLTTMTALTAPGHTLALVVAELRAEDALRNFLEGWIGLGWHVWSVAESLLGPRWGMWVAWCEN
jgi:protein N-lysine methyltransferase METTL21D